MLKKEISYEIIRSKRKTMSLEIKADGRVVVRAPLRLSMTRIRRFVQEKEVWIAKNLEKIEARREGLEEIPKLSAEKKRCCKKRRAECFRNEFPDYARKIGVDYGKITIRQQKTRWGSCTSEGNLNFNWLLMLAPPEILDYVVVHELCHRKEMNHSAAFWREVEHILPDYRERKKWLKDNGWYLMEER